MLYHNKHAYLSQQRSLSQCTNIEIIIQLIIGDDY